MATERAIWSAEGEAKSAAVKRMFAEIAPRYDLLNSLMSLRLHHRWRAAAASKLELKPGGRALDLCCGTGDFLPHLRQAVGLRGNVMGIDFCQPMLDLARKKQPPHEAVAQLALGDACAIPVASMTLDGVSVGWGIRNVADVDQAHREIARVLKPGGRFVSLDMARPCNPLVRAASSAAFRTLVPLMGWVFGKKKAYTYLPESTRRFMSRDDLAESMRRAGLVNVGYQDYLFGNICVHWGRKP